MELVRAIKSLVSLATTVVDRAGVPRGAVLFFVAAEVAGAGEGCGTAKVVAFKAAGTDVDISGSSGNSVGWKSQFGRVCESRLDLSAWGAIHFRSSSGGRHRVVEAIRAVEVFVSTKVGKLGDGIELSVGDVNGI